jgi:tRNA (guanine-N7-)-methyltransferase
VTGETPDAPVETRRRRLLYGRRKGPKLSAHQEQLLETLLPKLRLNLQAGADPKTYFSLSPPPCGEVDPSSGSGGGNASDVWLEIGFGAGEHLLWQAEHHPHVGMIGAEPYISGIAKLLSKLAQLPDGQGENIRVHDNDARDILEALPDACLGRVFILFPDPWPKSRHHKRRFIQMNMLDVMARVMKPGAELRFASDDADYAAWTLERVIAHPAFEWTATRARDWKTRPNDWPETRYEAKALHGPPVFLQIARRANMSPHGRLGNRPIGGQ